MNSTYKAIRRSCFQKQFAVDTRLQELLLQHTDMRKGFLLNDASHHVFQYLTHYVKTICEHHFKRNADCIRTLDWGCGHGHVSYFLKQEGMDVASCDVEEERGDSSFGQAVPIIDYAGIRVDPLTHPYKLPYESGSFDVVVSFGVLEHVPNDLESLKEIHRVLAKGGLFLCFFLPAVFSWTQFLARRKGDLYHDRLYSRQRVQALLKTTQFTLLDFWHRAVFPKNLIEYKNVRFFEQTDQWITNYTPFKYISTNVEFAAVKPAS